LQRGADARRAGGMQGEQVAESTTGGRISGAIRGEATRGREALINDAADEFTAQAEGRAPVRARETGAPRGAAGADARGQHAAAGCSGSSRRWIGRRRGLQGAAGAWGRVWSGSGVVGG
jgi:hypothetical protein